MYQKHPGFKLIVTGHSLGGGVATLFTILFHEGVFSMRNCTATNLATGNDRWLFGSMHQNNH
jgi:putative lipase involved disintegration of autophagic bodies